MVAPGKGILAADESTGTIKKRFDSIGLDSTEDNRRDYRELFFRADEAMKNYISGVILYDETIRQKAKDGTPLVELIKAAGAIPGIKVDAGAKPLAVSPGETITEGLDGLRERLKEYYGLGARFAKWRAVINIGPACPSYNCIHANAHALARYAALCQEADIVPIVEPEVLMDGPDATHDIDTCYEVTDWIAEDGVPGALRRRRQPRGHGAEAEHGRSGQEEREEGLARGGRREDGEGAQGLRARRPCPASPSSRAASPTRTRPRISADERHGRPAVDAHLLLRPRAAGGGAEGLGRQAGERGGGAARLRPSRPDERPCRHRRLEAGSREKGGVTPANARIRCMLGVTGGRSRRDRRRPFARERGQPGVAADE